MSEQHLGGSELFVQVSDNMKSVIDMTSRIDERVKIIMEKQIENDKRLLSMMDHLNNLSARVSVLESRDGNKLESIVEEQRKIILQLEKDVEILKLHNATHNEKWKNIFSTILQIATAGAVGWLMYKLGMPSP